MDILHFIKLNEPLHYHCTLKIGGLAKYFSEPETEEQVASCVRWAKQNLIPYIVIGHGSNILFDDDGFCGLVIKMGPKFSNIEVCAKTSTVKAKAGAWMPYVARKCQTYGLTGLEHTAGIPGNIGGIITMNAGSQRKSISSDLVSVKYLDENLDIRTIESKDGEFGYRKSIFQNKDWVILEALFSCNIGEVAVIRRDMLKILRERRDKFPRKSPNCGSVFKSNPAMYENYGPPGKIIEDLGMKGKCIGGICISTKHANFFINVCRGSSFDFLELLEFVKNKAKSKYGLEMIEEVQIVKSNKK